MLDLKREARRIFEETLQQVDVQSAVCRSLHRDGSHLFAGPAVYDLLAFPTIVIIAIGKAATPMYAAAARQLRSGPSLPAALHLEAIVVSPQRPSEEKDVLYFEGAHPTPDETSRLAASAILDRLSRVDARTLVLFLVSGGASSMVELPLDPSITIADVAKFNRTLVGSGLSITEMNVLRKHLSAIKGGRLAAAAAPAAQCTLIVSDVPAGRLDTVGSGPSVPDASSTEQCLGIFYRLRAVRAMPSSIKHFFEQDSLPETPKADHAAFQRAAWSSIQSSDDLAVAAASVATAAGFHTEIDNLCDEWDFREAAIYLLDRSAALGRRHGRTCLISVGEVTVAVGEVSGRGGRNQHFALDSALELAQRGQSATVLSAGSDGIDGNSPAAGAVADGDTIRRARSLGIDPLKSLAEFNSYPVFEALGDAILIGPTGNNLRDVRLLLTP